MTYTPTAETPEPVEDSGATVDVAGREVLLGRWAEIRQAARDLAGRPEIHRIDGLPMVEHRERVVGQLKYLVDAGAVHRAFPRRLGGEDNTAQTSPVSRNWSPPIPPCRSRPGCSGACSERPGCSWARRNTTTGGCPTPRASRSPGRSR